MIALLTRGEVKIPVRLIVGKHLKFELLEDMVFDLDGRRVVVPAGFVSDGASVPRFFWRMLPPFGEYLRAAILHDWLYRTGIMSKAESDAWLSRIAREDQTPEWQIALIHAGLAIGGGETWREYRYADRLARLAELLTEHWRTRVQEAALPA